MSQFHVLIFKHDCSTAEGITGSLSESEPGFHFYVCERNSNKFSIMSFSWDRMKHDDDAKRVPYQYSTRYILIAWKTHFIFCLSNNCSIFLFRTITSFVFSNSELHLQLPNFIYFNLPCCIQSVSTPIQEMALQYDVNRVNWCYEKSSTLFIEFQVSRKTYAATMINNKESGKSMFDCYF